MRSDGQRRHDAILDAAVEVFGKRGVLAVGIEDIRKRAKASPSSVYHHFGGMEPLVLALLTRTFTRLFAHLAARVTTATSARACVETLVDAHIEWVLANRVEARVMYELMTLQMSKRIATPLAKRKAALLAPVVAHFAPFIAKGKLPPWSPLLFDVVLLGVAHECCRRFLGGAPLDAKWMRAELPKLAWRSLPRAR
jgi:AcrR family transcriptional regulator